MLTKNLYQQVGLVNGIRGQVVEFVFADEVPPPNLPFYVVVKFRGYSGGEWSSHERYRGRAPISPVDTTRAGRGNAGQDATAVEALLGHHYAQITGTEVREGRHRPGGRRRPARGLFSSVSVGLRD